MDQDEAETRFSLRASSTSSSSLSVPASTDLSPKKRSLLGSDTSDSNVPHKLVDTSPVR